MANLSQPFQMKKKKSPLHIIYNVKITLDEHKTLTKNSRTISQHSPNIAQLIMHNRKNQQEYLARNRRKDLAQNSKKHLAPVGFWVASG